METMNTSKPNGDMKPKRRVLTAREKLMRERCTRLVDWPVSYAVFLVVGCQTFQIGVNFETKKEAEWMRDMIAIALSGIEL